MSLMVWGHRGHRYHRSPAGTRDSGRVVPHENTLDAYRQSLAAVHGVEADIVQSRLKTPYLVHDTLFNGMVLYELRQHLDEASAALAGDRYIFQMADDEIDALRLKDGRAIPPLRDLLALMQGFQQHYVNLELKGPHVADIAIRSVERAIWRGMVTPAQIVFSSYNIPVLRGLRASVGTRFAVGLSFMVNSYPMAQMYPNWPLAEQEAYYVPFSIEALQRPDITEIQPDFFNIEAGSLDLETLEAIHFFYPKARIILWCAGEGLPEEDTRLADTVALYEQSGKIFAVTSDYPVDMLRQLQVCGVALLDKEAMREELQEKSQQAKIL